MTAKLYIMATACSRVTWPSGLKLPFPVPEVMPWEAPQRTAWVYQLLPGTSLKAIWAVVWGDPASRWSTDMSMARFMEEPGEKWLASMPENRPFS